MPSKDLDREGTTQGECTDCSTTERSFDDLAKGLADGTMSRGRALRLLGGAFAGVAVSSVPGLAWARRRCRRIGRRCNRDRQCCSRNCIDNPNGDGKICGCRSGKTLCNDQCVEECTAPEVLDPNTCECVPAAQCQSVADCANAVPAPNQCQQRACTNGRCVVENKPDGTQCNDDNPCMENGQCTEGVCAGTQIEGCVECESSDDCADFPVPGQCQEAFCDQTTGTCAIRNKANGTACNDQHACTENDVCTAGVCAGTLKPNCVECQRDSECASVPVDQCHRAVCGAAGFCVVENKPDNTACDDNNACTENDVCTAGVCVGAPVAGCVPCQTVADCSGGKTCQSGRCECPTGTTLCPGNNTCVQNCPEGETLNPTTCLCETETSGCTALNGTSDHVSCGGSCSDEKPFCCNGTCVSSEECIAAGCAPDRFGCRIYVTCSPS